MHELGVIMHVVEIVEDVMKEEDVTEVAKIVLQVGELSSVIPLFLKKCFPAAVDGTVLQNTELEIETIPGNAVCKDCRKMYHLLSNKKICPYCGGKRWELLCGNEFSIKEIVAR